MEEEIAVTTSGHSLHGGASEEVNEFEEIEEEEIVEEEVDPRKLLTKEQIQSYKELFDSIDFEKKEKIPTGKIGSVLRLLGSNPTKAQIKEIMKEIDTTNTGLIDFESFLLPIARRLHEEKDTPETIIEAFKTLIDEESDYITTEKLQEYLTTMGEDLDRYELELMLKIADPKGTKKVYYREFVEKMMGVVRKKEKKGKENKKGKSEKGGNKEKKKTKKK